jgi:hypothetical protein
LFLCGGIIQLCSNLFSKSLTICHARSTW